MLLKLMFVLVPKLLLKLPVEFRHTSSTPKLFYLLKMLNTSNGLSPTARKLFCRHSASLIYRLPCFCYLLDAGDIIFRGRFLFLAKKLSKRFASIYV